MSMAFRLSDKEMFGRNDSAPNRRWIHARTKVYRAQEKYLIELSKN